MHSESRDYLNVTFNTGTSVRIASHASSLAYNIGDYSCIEGIKEASR